MKDVQQRQAETAILSLFRKEENGFFEYAGSNYILNPISKSLIGELVGMLEKALETDEK